MSHQDRSQLASTSDYQTGFLPMSGKGLSYNPGRDSGLSSASAGNMHRNDQGIHGIFPKAYIHSISRGTSM